MKYFKEIISLFHNTATLFGRDRGPLLAAALAYYTLFSLAPLLVISVAVAGFVFGDSAVEGEIVGQIKEIVGQDIAKTIQLVIENAASVNSSGVLTTIVSVILLFVGASGVFGQLKTALNMMWGIYPKPEQGLLSLIKKRALAFLMVLGIGFLILTSLAISIGLTALRQYLNNVSPNLVISLPRLDIVASLIIIIILFAIVFKILPDAKVTWKDVWLGAAVTGLLFGLGEYLIGWYLTNRSVGSAYGAAGSLMVILIWIYYSALIVMFGAEFTQVYANKYGSKIRASDNALLFANPTTVEKSRNEVVSLTVEENSSEENNPSAERQILKQVSAGLIGLAVGLFLAFVSSLRRRK